MKDIKKAKFLGNYYPYMEFEIFDYNKVKDVTVKVSTDKLEYALQEALISDDKALNQRANEFDPSISIFIPEKILLNKPQEEIKKYVEQIISNK